MLLQYHLSCIKICIYLQVTFTVVVVSVWSQFSRLISQVSITSEGQRVECTSCLHNTQAKPVSLSVPSVFLSLGSFVFSFGPHSVSHNLYCPLCSLRLCPNTEVCGLTSQEMVSHCSNLLSIHARLQAGGCWSMLAGVGGYDI